MSFPTTCCDPSKLKDSQIGSHLCRDDRRIQSNKDHEVFSDLFRSKRKCKTEGYHVYCMSTLNMWLFLVDCLINWDDKEQQRTSSTRCLQKKDRVLTTPRSSKSPFPDSVGLIDNDIEVYHWQIPTLPRSHHSYKPLCTGWSEVIIIFTETRRATQAVSVYLDSWCVCDQTNTTVTPCLRVLSCLDLWEHFRLLSSILNRVSVSITPSVTPDILRCASEEDTPMSGFW